MSYSVLASLPAWQTRWIQASASLSDPGWLKIELLLKMQRGRESEENAVNPRIFLSFHSLHQPVLLSLLCGDDVYLRVVHLGCHE